MNSKNYERTTDNILDLAEVRRKHELAGGISHTAIIDSVPGIEQSTILSSEESVANINRQLAERDPNLPSPGVQAGDHGTVAQRGNIVEQL